MFAEAPHGRFRNLRPSGYETPGSGSAQARTACFGRLRSREITSGRLRWPKVGQKLLSPLPLGAITNPKDPIDEPCPVFAQRDLIIVD